MCTNDDKTLKWIISQHAATPTEIVTHKSKLFIIISFAKKQPYLNYIVLSFASPLPYSFQLLDS